MLTKSPFTANGATPHASNAGAQLNTNASGVLKADTSTTTSVIPTSALEPLSSLFLSKDCVNLVNSVANTVLLHNSATSAHPATTTIKAGATYSAQAT